MRLSKQNKIVVGVIALVLALTVGYALFSESLNINGTAKASGDFGLEFVSIDAIRKEGYTDASSNGSASEEEIKQKIASIVDENGKRNRKLNVTVDKLNYPGAYVEIDATIKNVGTIDAILKGIEVTSEDGVVNDKTISNDDIEITYSGVAKDYVMRSDENDSSNKRQITIKVRWKESSANKNPAALTFNIGLNFEQVTGNNGGNDKPIINDKAPILAENSYKITEESESFTQIMAMIDSGLFNGPITRFQLENLKFVNVTETPEGYGENDKWDASLNSNNSVIAWYKPNGNKATNNSGNEIDLYDVVIGANGKVQLPSDCNSLFAALQNLKSIDLSNVDTSNVLDMSFMFVVDQGLTNLDLSNFNTKSVTNMSYMFSLSGLTNLNLSNFDTSSVTNMSGMFNTCTGLTNLDLGNFNTSNVTDMSTMFGNDNNLTSLNVSSFDTRKVTNMYYMFDGCSSLTALDLTNFNTSNVTNMYQMFSNCKTLTTLILNSFDTRKVTNMKHMFWHCKALTTLDLSNFNTGNVVDMSSMFSGCEKITCLDIRGFTFDNVSNYENMLLSVPGDILIYVKDDTAKNFILNVDSYLRNVQIAS